MGAEKRKGGLPVDEAAEREREGRTGGEAGAPREAIDEREEDGYSQPESSAQKAPPPGPGKDDLD